MSYIGANKIGGMHLGSTTIAKAYLGSDLVYQKSGGTPSLPYDAEVEYLQSSGTQYIDTGYTANNTDDFEITVDTDATSGFFGSNGNLQVKMTYGKDLGRREIKVIRSQNYGPVTYVNGNQIATERYNNLNGYHILLFALGNRATSAGPSNYTSCKCYSVVLKINDVIVRDFIPVRVGQVGYMYDKISGTLFGNDGTGSFVIGNDIT